MKTSPSRPHVSPWSLPDMAERTAVVSSLSKSHAIPGFRFVWVIGPPSLSRHLFNLLLCMVFGGPAFIQDGVLAALESEWRHSRDWHGRDYAVMVEPAAQT
jgi:arginine:pyruvate transaminase